MKNTGFAIILTLGGLIGLTFLIPESCSFESQNSVSAMRARREAEQQRIAKLSPQQLAAEIALKNKAIEVEKLKQEKAAEEQKKIADAEKLEHEIKGARGACLVQTKESLHDPYSAEFGKTRDWFVEVNKDGTILVQPKFRAKNAFGAYRQATYNCLVKPVPAGYLVISLEQIN